MWTPLFVLILITLNVLKVNTQDEDYSYFETTTIGTLADGEKKLSESIRKALEHFKKPNSDGLPGLDIPDPYFVPDMKQSIGFGTNLVLKETALHGISKFRVLYIKTEIEDMECHGALIIDKLQIHGKYELKSWLSSYKGVFTANVTNIKATSIATLGVEVDGKLSAQDISLDIAFENIAVNFENAGFLVSMISGVFNSMGTFLFESLKPVLLKDAHTKMRQEINNKLDQVVGDIKFPNTISPIDMIIICVRKKLQRMEMDPFKFNDYDITTSIYKIKLTNTWVSGLSSIYRVGNISLYIENSTLIADFNIGTQDLKGSTQWEVSGIGFIHGTGSSSFTVKYIEGRLILAQPLDTRQNMEFRDLELEIGNIQLGFDGAGTLDYLIEFSANILPTLLRYQIMDSIRNPIKLKIQQELNRINVEDMIINELPKIDKMQEEGFKLSTLRLINTADNLYDEDDFFNF